MSETEFDEDERDLEQEALDALTAALRAGAPEGWTRIDLTARMLAGVYESELFYCLEDGSTVAGPVDDPDLRGLLHEYRVASFGGLLGGPWFLVRLYVPRDGGWWSATDNRWEPHWRSPVPDKEYRADYELFPWDFPRMPRWLPDKVLAKNDTHA